MITPILIQVLFWLVVLFLVGLGLVIIVGNFALNRPKTEIAALGVACMVIGPLLVRLYCEMFMIIFKIHDELKAANNRERYRG